LEENTLPQVLHALAWFIVKRLGMGQDMKRTLKGTVKRKMALQYNEAWIRDVTDLLAKLVKSALWRL
jgi:hypothetical protein